MISLFRFPQLFALAAMAMIQPLGAQQFLLGPEILSMEAVSDTTMLVTAQVPAGYRHVVLEQATAEDSKTWQPLIAGAVSGDVAQVEFRVPLEEDSSFFRITAGLSPEVPEAMLGGSAEFLEVMEGNGGHVIPSSQRLGHVLSRLAYGPSELDYQRIKSIGVRSYIEQQLNPQSIDEEANLELQRHTARLFEKYIPDSGETLVEIGDSWRYFKGLSEPPSDWKDSDFDDASWLIGPSGIGYGDDDDATILSDMRQEGDNNGYLSVYARMSFDVAEPSALANLFLEIDYDDSFVAYLNGQEIARANVTGTPPSFDEQADRAAGSVDGNVQTVFDVSAFVNLLQSGANTLALQGHNANLTSSDFSLIPSLGTLEERPFPTIRSVGALQEWIHVRGVHSQRQLQAVLGEFWENHFTTDYDKVSDFLDDMDEFRTLEDDRRRSQARSEAAQMEWEEYEFFYGNAFGYFGDLLLRSATSPSMAVYLDNVQNLKDAPNENYAREILELHAFGVDNRYTQTDIEQLAKCFTGWTLRKIHPARRKAFPESARDPETNDSRSIASSVPVIDLGETWQYFKGTQEPTPEPGGEPSLAWTEIAYNDGAWLSGPTGIGYDDEDDATVLEDMRNNYASVYLRTEFEMPTEGDQLVVELDYDDGYVAYLNGTEIGRSRGMRDLGSPPAFDAFSTRGHEAKGVPDIIDLAPHAKLLQAKPNKNVLAIQVHNTNLSSSDLSILPRLLSISYAEDSIDVTDPDGVWTFRYNPEQHENGEKILFAGTEHEITIPGGRKGQEGVQDAIEVIDAMVRHPSTAEFIVIKLVNRFVSDGISLGTYHDRSAPEYLLYAVDDAIVAWQATTPAGHIGTVMEAILDPVEQQSAFWKGAAHFSKVKSPVEFINSTYRALGATIIDDDLPDQMEDMAMTFFQRDEPDGYSELGLDWVDTLSVLERVRFCQALSANLNSAAGEWDLQALMDRHEMTSAEDVIDYFNDLLFQGLLAEGQKTLLLRFANTDDAGEPSPADSLRDSQRLKRLRQTVGLLLSSPGFHFQ